MTVLLEPDVLARDAIRDAIGASARIVTSLDELNGVMREDLATLEISSVVLGPSIDLEVALDFAERMRATNPSLGVVLVRRRIDAAVLGQSSRAGVREVVGERDLRGLTGAVARSRSLTLALRNRGQAPTAEPGEPAGQIITVFSPKGGAGKTTLATNMGVLLAQRGYRVLILDLDLAFGDVPIFLGLRPEHTFEDVLGMGERLDAAALGGLVTVHESGLHVLAPPTDPSFHEAVRTPTLHHLLQVAASEYQYVIIDTAPSMDERVITIMEASGTVFVVTTLDIPSLKNVKIALETLRLVNFPLDRLQVVMNRADSKVGLDSREVGKTLGIPVTSFIPSSRLVPAATNRGVPVVTDQPKSPVTQALAALVSRVVLKEAATERRTGLFAFRSRS